MIKQFLISVLFSLAFSRKFGIIKDKERYKFLTMIDIREFYWIIDIEQKILQDLYFKTNTLKARQAFKGGYLALEKLKLEAKNAKRRYFEAEATEAREKESNLESNFDNVD